VLARASFGRTGHESSRVIFGAAALWNLSQDEADTLLPVLRRHGVNHLDTAASYGDSEVRLRPWLERHRKEFFLATKTDARDGVGARAELERSLERLGVGEVDLIQLHNLVEEDEFERAHAKGGAVEALERAREEGLVRFIGVTGHGLRIPSMHRRSLQRFPFDSVLFPYNYALLCDDNYRHDVEELLALCAETQVAAQAIKAVARRRWVTADEAEKGRSWYEPLAQPDAITRAVKFVLGRESLFLISSSDYQLLDLILGAAEGDPASPPAGEMEEDQSNFGITALFDGDELERI
jgi:aryl-alcohol dehydrogenase-like predicted oxidoreductase